MCQLPVSRFVFLACLALGAAYADTLINFDDLTPDRIINDGGGDIGSFYSSFGVTFGPNITGLDQSTSGSGTAFPPHSPPIVAFGLDNSVTISFSSLQSFVSFFYTSFDPLTVTAFDVSHVPLASSTFVGNTDGTTGFSDLARINASDISSIELSATADSFIFDDLTFPVGPAAAVPEPNSLILIAIISSAVIFFRKKATIFLNWTELPKKTGAQGDS